jgi:hypothetical protein
MKKAESSPPTPPAVQNPASVPPRDAESATIVAPENISSDSFVKTILLLRENGADSQELVQLVVTKLLLRIFEFFCQIERAYAGQPYVPGIMPDTKINQQRSRAYVADLGRATQLLRMVSALEVDTRSSKVTVAESGPRKFAEKAPPQSGTPVAGAPSDIGPETITDRSQSPMKKARGSANKNVMALGKVEP